jgi:Flp pilus assembly protein CpaB
MTFGKKSGSLPRRSSLLATRRGNVIIAVSLAIFAGVLLVIFLHNYKKTLTDTSIRKVLVAQRLIQQGASANVLAHDDTSFKVVSVRQNQLKSGAVLDPSSINNKVATRDIFPGDQITGSDFAKSSQPVLTDVQGASRAMSIALDNEHGMIGDVRAGDYVDVLSSFSDSGNGATLQAFARLLIRNVLVLKAPGSAKSGLGVNSASGNQSAQTVVLRVNANQEASIAYAADNGKLWLALRPKAGAIDPPVSKATISRLASGVTANGGTITVSQAGQKPVKITVKPTTSGGH